MAIEKKQIERKHFTTILEAVGVLFVFGGLAAWSLPLAFVVTGVIMIVAGGLAA